jgi:hypothetical protein
MSQFETHEHFFVSGPRSKSGYGKDGKWQENRIRHSHPEGNVPHTHPATGPSFYGYRNPKFTKRPTGEQMEVILRTPEENTFELIITDSALIHGETPIGNTPIEVLGFPAAQRMVDSFGLTCIIRDERTGGTK